MEFMTHPQHGATLTNDVAEHEKNGWSISTPEEWTAGKNSVSSTDTPAPEYSQKKRGRPPKAE